MIDEFIREYLTIQFARRINNFGVIQTFADAMLRHGIPAHIRSDNGSGDGRHGCVELACQDPFEDLAHRAVQHKWKNGCGKNSNS